MEKNITNIFLECQTSVATHPKLIKKLKDIYLKSDFEKFCSHFIHLMKYSLIYEDKHPMIERTLAFVAKFSTSVKSLEEKKADSKEKDEEKEEEEDYDIDPFLVAIFRFLLQNHEANSRAVRLRVCQLINKILNSMGEEASIDDQLYNTIYDTMLQRLMDKVPAVRVQAIHALSRLQDPHNKDCPIIKAYLFHLSMDPNHEVRKAVLSSIAITFQTLPAILDRIRDTHDLVRRQAYLTLSQKVHLRSFTIAQRILIASEGLNDRSKMVRQVVRRNLLKAWLQRVNGSILELLKCLDVEASTESAELILKSLFKDMPYSDLLENFGLLDGNRLVSLDQLKPEVALYWKCLVEHLRAEKAEDYLDELLPDLTAFCDYLREWVSKSVVEDEVEQDPQETAVKMMEKEFVCQQLIDLTTMFDLSDEVGRKNLCSLVHQLLLSLALGETCIRGLSKIFALLYPPVSRINQLVEIISELREPPDNATQKGQDVPVSPKNKPNLSEEERRKNKIKIAQLSVKINQVKDELEECVRSLDIDRARELKEDLEHLEMERTKTIQEGPMITPHSTPVVPSSQIRMPEEEEEELKQLDDPETLSRCLLLVCEFLSSPDITTLGPILRSLHDNLILPCLKSEDLGVRRYAVRALALTCLLSKEMAQHHLLLFVQVSQMDAEEIQSEALRGLFDFWLVYGVEEFNSVAEDVNELPGFALESVPGDAEVDGVASQGPSVGNMIALLTKMLETESSDARTLTVEGLCKLLLSSRICSSKLLSHLVLLWYNPNTEDDHLLRHILGVFFPFYASLGDSHQESLCGAMIPTLHTLSGAPARSPLSDVDVEDVVNFMVSITSPAIVSKKSSEMVNAHDSLVFTLCAEILAFPERFYIRALVRCLSHLSLSPSNFTTLRQVLCLTQKMLKKIEEKRLLNYLDKFQQIVQNALQLAPKSEDEDDQPKDTTLEVDNDVETTQNCSKFKRKRILYSSQNDVQLVSDLDTSENEGTPSKTKRLSKNQFENEVFASENYEHEITKGDETEEESGSENDTIGMTTMKHSGNDSRSITLMKEIEVATEGIDSSPEKTNLTSSDLFGSAEERDEPDATNSEEGCEASDGKDDSEEDEYISRQQSSSCSESPPRKSPKFKMLQAARGAKMKFPHFCTVGESKQNFEGSPSSSSSFYSARSTTKSSDLSSPITRKETNSGESASATGSNAAEGRTITRGPSSINGEKMNTGAQGRKEPSTDDKSSTKEIVPRLRTSLRSISSPSSTAKSGKKLNVRKRPSPKKSPPARGQGGGGSEQSLLSSVSSEESSVVRRRCRPRSTKSSTTNEDEGNTAKTNASNQVVRATRLRSSLIISGTPASTPAGTKNVNTRTRLSLRISSSASPSSEEPSQRGRNVRSARKKERQ